MKKILSCLLLTVILLFNNNICTKEELVLLTNPVLRSIDGIRGMMDETHIHQITTLCKEINRFVYGNLNEKTKIREPQHMFQGKKYILEELVKIEESIDRLKNTNINEYTQKFTSLRALLEKLKDDTMKMLHPFLLSAKGSYSLIKSLIQESCVKRGRHDSELFNWDPKNEETSLKKNVHSIKSLHAFLLDLNNLQKDILHSCPKAIALYKKWLQSHKLISKL